MRFKGFFNRMAGSRVSLLFALLVISPTSHAWSYKITGTIELVATTAATNDLYRLDGAEFSWLIEMEPAAFVSDYAEYIGEEFVITASQFNLRGADIAGFVVDPSRQYLDRRYPTYVKWEDWGQGGYLLPWSGSLDERDRLVIAGGQSESVFGTDSGPDGTPEYNFYLQDLLAIYPLDFFSSATPDWSMAESVTFGTEWDLRYFESETAKDEYKFSNVTIVATPIPAAVWLFGSGLAGLAWFRRN